MTTRDKYCLGHWWSWSGSVTQLPILHIADALNLWDRCPNTYGQDRCNTYGPTMAQNRNIPQYLMSLLDLRSIPSLVYCSWNILMPSGKSQFMREESFISYDLCSAFHHFCIFVPVNLSYYYWQLILARPARNLKRIFFAEIQCHFLRVFETSHFHFRLNPDEIRALL